MSVYTVGIDFNVHNQNFHAMLDSRRKDRRDNYLNSIDLTPKDKVTYYSQIGNKTTLDPIVDNKHAHVDVEHNRLKETTYTKDSNGNIDDVLLVSPESTTFQPDSELSTKLVEFHGKDKVKDPNDIANLNVVMRDSLTGAKFIPSNKSAVPLDQMKQDNKLTSYINKLHTSTVLATTLTDHHKVQTANYDLASSSNDTSESDLQYVNNYIESIFSCSGLTKTENGVTTKLYFNDLVKVSGIKTYYNNSANLYGTTEVTDVYTTLGTDIKNKTANVYILKCKPSSLFDSAITTLATQNPPIYIYSTSCLSCLELLSKMNPVSTNDVKVKEFMSKFNVQLVQFGDYIDYIKDYYIQLIKNVYHRKFNYDKYVNETDNRKQVVIQDSSIQPLEVTDDVNAISLFNREATSEKINGLVVYHGVVGNNWKLKDEKSYVKFSISASESVVLEIDKDMSAYTEILVYKKIIPSTSESQTESSESTETKYTVIATKANIFNASELVECEYEEAIVSTLNETLNDVQFNKITIADISKEVVKGQCIGDVPSTGFATNDSVFDKTVTLEIKPTDETNVEDAIIYYKVNVWQLKYQKGNNQPETTLLCFQPEIEGYKNNVVTQFKIEVKSPHSDNNENKSTGEYKYYAKLDKDSTFKTWKDGEVDKTSLQFVVDIKHVTYAIECKLGSKLDANECYVVIQLTGKDTYQVTKCYDKEFDSVVIKSNVCQVVQPVSPDLYKLTFQDKAGTPITDESSILSHGYLANIPLSDNKKIHSVIPRTVTELYAVKVNDSTDIVTYSVEVSNNVNIFKPLPIFTTTNNVNVDITLSTASKDTCKVYTVEVPTGQTSVTFGDVNITDIPSMSDNKIVIVVGEGSTNKYIMAICNSSYNVIEAKVDKKEIDGTKITQTADDVTVSKISYCSSMPKLVKTSNLIFHQVFDSTDVLTCIQLRDDVQSDVIPLYCKLDGSNISELYNSNFDRLYPTKQSIYSISSSKLIPEAVRTPMNQVKPTGTTTVIEHRLKDNETYKANLISFTTVASVPYYTIKKFRTTSDDTYEIVDNDDKPVTTISTINKEDVVILKDATDISTISGIRRLKDLYSRNVAYDYNVLVVKNKADDKNCALLDPLRLSSNINLLINSKNEFKLIDSDVETLKVTELPLPTLTGSKTVSTTSANDFIHKTYNLTLKVKHGSDEAPEYYNLVFENVAVTDDNYSQVAFDMIESVDGANVTYSVSDKYVKLTEKSSSSVVTQASVGTDLHAYNKFVYTELSEVPSDSDKYIAMTTKSSTSDMISFTMTRDEIIGALKQTDNYYILPLKIKKVDDSYVYFTAQTDSKIKDYLNSSLTFYFSRPDYKCIAIKDEFNFIPQFEEFKYEKGSYTDEDFTTPTIPSKYTNRYHFEIDLTSSNFSSTTEFRGSVQYQGYVWDIKLADFTYTGTSLQDLNIKLNFTDYNTVTLDGVTGLDGQTIGYSAKNSSVKFGFLSQFEDKQQDFKKKGRYINIPDVSKYVKQALDKKCICFKTNIVNATNFDDTTYSEQLGFYIFTEANVDNIQSLQLILDVNNNDIYGDDFKLDVIQAVYVSTVEGESAHDITHNIVVVPFYVDELYNDVEVISDCIIKSDEIKKSDYTSKIEREKLFLSIDTDNDDQKLADFVFTDIMYPTNGDNTINQAIRPIVYVVKGYETDAKQEVVCLTYDSRDDNLIANDDAPSGFYCDSHISDNEETQITYSEASVVSSTPKTLDTTVGKYSCYDFTGLTSEIGEDSTLELRIAKDKSVTLTFSKIDTTQLTDNKITINRVIIALDEDENINPNYVFAMSGTQLVNCKIQCSDPTTPTDASSPLGVKKHFYRAVSDEIVSAKTGSPEASFGVKFTQPDTSVSYWTIQCAAPTKIDIANNQKLVISGKFEDGKYTINDDEDLQIIDAVSGVLTEKCRINKITKVNGKRISAARKNEYIQLQYYRSSQQSFTIDDTTQYLYKSNILAKDDTQNAYTIAKIDVNVAKINVDVDNIDCSDSTPVTNQHSYITGIKNNNVSVNRKATDVSKLRQALEVRSSDAATETSINGYVIQLTDVKYPYINTLDSDEPTPEPPLTLTPLDWSKESVGYILGLLEGKTILKHKFSNDNQGYFTVYYIYNEDKKLEYITIGHIILSVDEIKSKVGNKAGEVQFKVNGLTFQSKRISLDNGVNGIKDITITSDIKPFGVLDTIFKDLIVKRSSMEFEVGSLNLYQQDFKDISYIDDCRVECDVIFTQGMCINNYEPLLKDKCVDVDIVTGVLLKSFRLSTTVVCKKLSFNGDKLVVTEGYFEDYPYIPINPDVVVLTSGELKITPIVKSDNDDINNLSLVKVKIASGARLFFIPVKIVKVKPTEYTSTFIQPWISTEQLLGLTQCYTIPKRTFVEYDRFMSMIKPTTFEVNKGSSYLTQHKISSTQIRYSLDNCDIDLPTSTPEL